MMGRLRPDAIVNVPGQKKLVIDSKVSLNAYQAAYEADDEDERQAASSICTLSRCAAMSRRWGQKATRASSTKRPTMW